MNEIIYGELCFSEIELSKRELSKRIGRPASPSDADIKELTEELLSVSNIRYAATRVKILEISGDAVRLEGFSVKSKALAAYLSGAAEAFMLMITLGIGADRLIKKNQLISLSRGFLLDGVASALIEAACDAAEKKICGGRSAGHRFSPGYADCPLSVQKDFARLLTADKYIGIKLLDSELMTPMKSISAFIKAD